MSSSDSRPAAQLPRASRVAKQRPAERGAAYRSLSVLPAVVLAMLPRLACPCQIPAYAGLLGWLGLAFLLESSYLVALNAAFLTFAVGGLAIGARRRRGYAPFALGALAALLVMTGKFVLPASPCLYLGLLLLLLACLWNCWPRRCKIRFTADGQVERAPAVLKRGDSSPRSR